ncbi:hypothetical protein ACH5RR_012479 [Cinchona calisaya]|uniref:Uncharacterized protein n=1 Tax=Cinchona calisaya TaxID=153742 RepID=A0ABD3ADP2_9GENT
MASASGDNPPNTNNPVPRTNDYALGDLMMARKAHSKVIVKKVRKIGHFAPLNKQDQLLKVGTVSGFGSPLLGFCRVPRAEDVAYAEESLDEKVCARDALGIITGGICFLDLVLRRDKDQKKIQNEVDETKGKCARQMIAFQEAKKMRHVSEVADLEHRLKKET